MTDPNTRKFKPLSDREREALLLLAKGHTVKSIAEQTGHSVGAVNERLREARRKTGVGSSRELARLLAAQENWDDKIGVSSAQHDGAVVQARSIPRGTFRSSKGAIMMIPIATIAILAVAAMQNHGPVTERGPAPKEDPILHLLVQTEPRDEKWAPASETALANAYAAILQRYGLRGQPKVRCAKTICEVSVDDFTPHTGSVNALMDELQGPTLRAVLKRNGLDAYGAMFRSTAYKAYWKRTDYGS